MAQFDLPGLLSKSERPVKTAAGQKAIQQYLTPEWAAARLVERYFPELNHRHRVAELGCGHGAFLKALPSVTDAVGVDIDPDSVDFARLNTGRSVILGDFRFVELPWQPTHIIGNPPFSKDLVDALIERADELLPKNGRMGLILPTHSFQYASSLKAWQKNFSIHQDAIPREIFDDLSIPISFVLFEKNKQRHLHGFFLYDEVSEVNQLKKHIKLLLREGRPRRGVWKALVLEAIEYLGGRATLDELYAWCGDKRPTENQFWKEKIRQVAQTELERVGPGTYVKAA